MCSAIGRGREDVDAQHDVGPVELLRSVPLFSDLEQDELERFSLVAVPRSFPAATRVSTADVPVAVGMRNWHPFIKDALAELAAAFPVYRTYIGDDGVHDVDRRHRRPGVVHAMFEGSKDLSWASYTSANASLLTEPSGPAIPALRFWPARMLVSQIQPSPARSAQPRSRIAPVSE